MIRLGTTGIVVDQFGQVLLIRRDDTRTWAPPAGALELHELPAEGVVREVREETGLTVLPVRLVGLFHTRFRDHEYLSFSYRCLRKSGELRPSRESPKVAFVSAHPLPSPMLTIHRERVQQGLAHAGGTPTFATQRAQKLWERAVAFAAPLIYRFRGWRRKLRKEAQYTPPPSWRLGAFALIADESGRILWVRRADTGQWNLPGGSRNPGESPWTTAQREVTEETGLQISIERIAGIYLKPEKTTAVLNFTARARGGSLRTGPESVEFSFVTPGEEPDNTVPKQAERVRAWAAHRGDSLPHAAIQ